VGVVIIFIVPDIDKRVTGIGARLDVRMRPAPARNFRLNLS
jgi:hypothetical protein